MYNKKNKRKMEFSITKIMSHNQKSKICGKD